MSDTTGATMLGAVTPLPATPEDAVIETVPNTPLPLIATEQGHMWDKLGVLTRPLFSARFTCPEFTSLCPVTSQPDFATFVIDYIPHERMIESKALKLFMGSFRNHRGFHEWTTAYIGYRLFTAAKPHWMRVAAFWYARGGIPIDVFWEEGNRPGTMHIPPLDYMQYRGR